MDNACQGCVGTVVAVAVALGVAIFWFSYHTLEVTELGLDFNMITYSVEDRPYANGRWFLGVGHYFIKFPGQVQSLQFQDLRSRTSDGLEVVLELSFQYQFDRTNIYKVYNKFGLDYENFYVPLAIDEVTEQATLFNASTFFKDRTRVINSMWTSLREVFSSQGFCNVPSFQLKSVSLPSRFETAIQETEVQNQDIQTAQAERLNKEVSAVTEVLKAQKTANRIEINAQGSAETIKLNVAAYVQQYNLSQWLQAESFVPLYEKLGSDEALLLEYLNIRALRDHPSAKSVINVGALK